MSTNIYKIRENQQLVHSPANRKIKKEGEVLNKKARILIIFCLLLLISSSFFTTVVSAQNR